MRSFCSWGLLASSLLLFISPFAHAEPTVTVQVTVYWEGRELKEPNVDALMLLRKNFPAIPLTHLVNPAYFLDEAKDTDNLQSLQRVVQTDDEVGLYLAPIEALVRHAGIILKLQPSFWGYIDEGEVCENDCGLDVPLTVYNREEVLSLFFSAQTVMQKAGFIGMKSFAVRGWMEAPFVTQLASAFGYQVDLSPIDPNLIVPKLREFPISSWVAHRWGELINADPEALQRFSQVDPLVRKLPQMGGVLELTDQREILARFDRSLKDRREHPLFNQAFTLGISAETAFQSWPKLRMILQRMQERAKAQNFAVKFVTASSTKNSRPIATDMRISTRLSTGTRAPE